MFKNYLKEKLVENIKFIFTKINFFLKKQKIPDILNTIYIENTSRCNLKCKFCAYDKRDLDVVPYETMTQDMFKNVVSQSLDIGYRNIGLTPTTGDIFMDKNFFQKIEYLESLSHLKGYFFYSNFIPIKKEKIEELFKLKKLKSFGISIYGHDEDSFLNFSKGSKKSYNKLIENLETLNSLLNKRSYNFNLEISQRTAKNFDLLKSNSYLSSILKEIIDYKNVSYDKNSSFNNWGGIISKKDVSDLDIKLNSNMTKKIGSCSLIYSRLIIAPNGLVNACACRDANFTLKIGNINNDKLKNIINLKNPIYKDLIIRQEKNDFPDVCKSCDFYRSIYQKNYPIWSMREEKIKTLSLRETLKILESR